MKDVIRVGILGLGVVGSGAVRTLQENGEAIARKIGAPIVIKRIAVRNLVAKRAVEVPAGVLTNVASDVIDDPEIDVVCELIGGVEPAHSYLMRALDNGKSVVTANKEMMAKAGHDLLLKAHEAHRDFLFEGSVGGGIPIIQPLKQALAGNRVREIMGIVNGTTNYILTKMATEGADFGDVLKEAQAHGYAESDPTADIEGYDAQYKTSILASIAFNSQIDPADIPVEGITKITRKDMGMADLLGYTIKLLGIGQADDAGLRVRVHPALLPKRHPLASVNDVYNAIYVRAEPVGDVMFYGRGAGSGPTGSAVVGDIIEIGRNILAGGTGRLGCTCFDSRSLLPMSSLVTKYYVRLRTHDRPKVLASVANVFGDFDVSLESVEQRPQSDDSVDIVLLTHRTIEQNMMSALDVLGRLPTVIAVEGWIRVEK
ncbi:MAG: homoserine dehydrogenase [Capsulimonadaceae bacterium]|nr:homoserine dehydrogenase [Capsulimonadaceae bacterium]